MLCNEAQRVQAYFDGELESGESVVIEQHLVHCGACAALIRDLQSTRDALREQVSYYAASDRLRGRVMQSIGGESAPQPKRRLLSDRHFWWGIGAGFAPAAIAAALLVTVNTPASTDQMAADLLNAHLRSLVSNHLIDVASSDQHTVKPWFAGHADVSPPAVDFPQSDYRLVGGRVDYVNGHRAAVVVYRHGAHVINVFAWPGDAEAAPQLTTHNGYHIACWRSGDLESCAVSDTAIDELLALTQLLKNSQG
ncbi:MAG: anti-sigma factor [Alphaproteobacteria bacterium]|nr:anti-sigma factor [Alphaproteobacteria bacterium]